MNKILVATHGYFANGIKSSIKLLTGVEENIYFLNAYVNDESIDKQIEHFFQSASEENEIIIFTDLYGGSVTQKIIAYASSIKRKVHLISGFNLPVILEVVLSTKKLTDQLLEEMVADSQKQMKLIELSNLSKQETEKDNNEDLFFN
ncbi:PTS fructose transporter subunit IIA [Weizmannia coagulans]|uniref:PTS system fructose subfamily IIA component n=3 Tax=Heyndrickxia TaxID=2837504 RepID=G2TJ84_HEYCO|nr:MULTISPECIES: PTS fructose transporter subunit IIA [Heyndrickxia]AEP00847.1 PTS system fructose subfamily IIA component [Heyndrickxia coagulans 36D1]AJO21247.1 PTS system fructose subfamily transporter subunit IIA [Heyndrickxia coagulans]AKN53117.1 PTS system, mannose-specific IIA component [Heyndrickxia coagulans]APB37462.1 PTS fructose transporter subunit IIA [Heyndrickxia coagulans]ATW81879.1 PTS fructose transporter subunit IIA [Heyndrickxia coagulans]